MSDEVGPGYFRGVVTGLIFGAAAALLLTPKKGDEIRHDLAGGAVKLKEKAGSLSGVAAENLSGAAGTVGDKARALKDQGAAALATAQKKIANSQGEQNDALAGTTDFAADAASEASAEKKAEVKDHGVAGEQGDKSGAHDTVDSV